MAIACDDLFAAYSHGYHLGAQGLGGFEGAPSIQAWAAELGRTDAGARRLHRSATQLAAWAECCEAYARRARGESREACSSEQPHVVFAVHLAERDAEAGRLRSPLELGAVLRQLGV
ncbi:MAG: hypothetical protein QM767_26770 [Anaeromyxobacter sp.]